MKPHSVFLETQVKNVSLLVQDLQMITEKKAF